MCIVVIVDPYSLDVVRIVFHGSLSIGELKFMAAIPSGKYIICDSGIAISVISILDGPLCGDGLLAVSCYRGHAKKFPPELRSGLHGIRAFPMVSVNGLVNMHGWQLVMQLDIFSVTIQKLKEKASFRNSDEFYYKMIKSKTKIEKLNSMLHSLDNQLTNKHIYYAEDSVEQSGGQVYILMLPSY
ncbi:hypothetical protein IFM89_016078 [Coptis chinensis]|uniref:Uncharacterized protein n=1 Tax=Coptis chinensis TaxID=261450 RepID=A0A835IED1_9MAGN|nr:hypothetical protein IFM89_016078 [Coptis chinensis]